MNPLTIYLFTRQFAKSPNKPFARVLKHLPNPYIHIYSQKAVSWSQSNKTQFALILRRIFLLLAKFADHVSLKDSNVTQGHMLIFSLGNLS